VELRFGLHLPRHSCVRSRLFSASSLPAGS
jgi:hypothetical protein